jgi:hypothetical protein
MLMMTKRNFAKELLYTYYADMENGDDVESIDYRSLIHIITELCDRIEALEKDKNEWFHPESGIASNNIDFDGCYD